MNLIDEVLPKQKKGAKTGATAKRHTSARREAISLFQDAKNRLLSINKWHDYSGNAGANFQLTDKSGNPINTPPEIGNLIRIDLPAPSNEIGDGYDWVRIEKFEHRKDQFADEELFGFRVRPVSNPANEVDESAHFYTDDATSSFLIYRSSLWVYAIERGRNEVPNPAGSILNKVRNAVVAIAAMLGFSKPQWASLMNGLLRSSG